MEGLAMNKNPVKIFVSYGEAIELRKYGISETFLKYFSRFNIGERDPYLIGDGFDFDRKWLVELFKKNHFGTTAVNAFLMHGEIIPFAQNRIDPPMNPTDFGAHLSREYQRQSNYFSENLKTGNVENIIKRFCLPPQIFFPESQIKHPSFFLWINYLAGIQTEIYDLLQDKALNGDDLCFLIALTEFGHQDDQRLTDEWKDLIRARLPGASFYLSESIKYRLERANYPLPKYGILDRQGWESETARIADSEDFIWASENFWKTLRKYDPKRGANLKSWFATAVKYDLLNRSKNENENFKIDPESLRKNPPPCLDDLLEDSLPTDDSDFKTWQKSDDNDRTLEAVRILCKNNLNKIQRVLKVAADNPKLTDKALARAAGVSAKTVQRFRKRQRRQ